MPASPIASNYLLNEWWAPLEVYGTRAPLRRKLRGQHKQIVTAKRLKKGTVQNARWRLHDLSLSLWALDDCVESSVSNTDCCYQWLSLAMIVITNGCHAAYLQLQTISSQDDLQHDRCSRPRAFPGIPGQYRPNVALFTLV